MLKLRRYGRGFCLMSHSFCSSLWCGCDAPDDIADVIRNEQRARSIHHHAHRAAERVAVGIEETGEHVFRRAGGPAAGERHEDDLVAAARVAVPGAVLAYKRAAGIARRQEAAAIEHQ